MVRYDAVENLRIFIKSCGVGFILGMLHCLLNLFFGFGEKTGAKKTVGDILFFFAAATVTFSFLLDANNGFFRVFIALGEGTGFLCFLLLPEKTVKIRFDSVKTRITLLRQKASDRRTVRRVKLREKKERAKKYEKTEEKSNKTLAYKPKDDI